MSYAVIIGGRAEREFLRLEPALQKRIAAAISALSTEPRPQGARKLRSTKTDCWRLRVGKYRVLYTVDDAKGEVVVYRVSLRERAYR